MDILDEANELVPEDFGAEQAEDNSSPFTVADLGSPESFEQTVQAALGNVKNDHGNPLTEEQIRAALHLRWLGADHYERFLTITAWVQGIGGDAPLELATNEAMARIVAITVAMALRDPGLALAIEEAATAAFEFMSEDFEAQIAHHIRHTRGHMIENRCTHMEGLQQ